MNKEIMRRNYEKTPKETLIDILISSRETIQKRNKEIKRLNNIINELEKYLNNSDFRCPDDLYVSACDDTLNKIKELKGSDKE